MRAAMASPTASTLAHYVTYVTPYPPGSVYLTTEQLAGGKQQVFRAKLCAASYSDDEMMGVMVETLRGLGYDVTAWDGREWTTVGR